MLKFGAHCSVDRERRIAKRDPWRCFTDGLIQAMEVDKKAAGGKIKFVMCEGIGKTRFHWLAPKRNLGGLGA